MAIAFCFLIKDSVNNLDLWSTFFKGIACSRFRIYVHAKTPFPVVVPDGAVIDADPLPTAWGDLSLVLATRRLFDQGWKDGCTSMVTFRRHASFKWLRIEAIGRGILLGECIASGSMGYLY